MKTYRQLLEEQNNLGKNFEKYRVKTDDEKDEDEKEDNEEEENRKKIVLPFG